MSETPVGRERSDPHTPVGRERSDPHTPVGREGSDPHASAPGSEQAICGSDPVTPVTPATFERCIARGGVVVFPADTVYGLACDPASASAVERLYALKGRPPDKPAAVMFFSLAAALAALPELGPRTRAALERLLPGGVTLLLPNPRRRFPLACGPDALTLGLRVPDVAALGRVGVPVLQSSANHAGGADPRRLSDVPAPLRAGADLVLDGGDLPGTPSTVIDLRRYEDGGDWSVAREGAVATEAVGTVLG